MKPFDPTKPVQTRDGRKARVLCTDRKTEDGYNIIASVVCAEDVEHAYYYRLDGTMSIGKSPNDLVNVPVKHKRWVNIYPNNKLGASMNAYEDRDAADDLANPSRIACIEIEFEEGQGL
jgi:hypothetical protein